MSTGPMSEEAVARAQQWHEEALRLPAPLEAGATASPATALDLSAELTGLEIVLGMLRGDVPQAPIGKTLRFRLVHAELGKAAFQSAPSEDFANPQGTMHGGWLATLLDGALGCAVRTTLPAGRVYTTLDLGIKYLKPLTARTALVRAEAQVVHSSRQTVVAEGRIVDAEGAIYARGTATCLVLVPKV